MIDISEISVSLGGQRILDRVSLRIEPGELVALIGANGAGKSTLVRALTGDVGLDKGTVTIADIPVSGTKCARLARMRAVLPQSSSLSFSFTAFEVALLGRTPHLAGSERPEDISVALACLHEAGVNHLRDRYVPTLSGGEQQRVQLARALAQIWDAEPTRRCLILDEPTASLDLTHKHTVLRLARRLADGGTTVLAVIHDLNLAARYANRVIVLKRGQIAADGSPGDVLTPSCLADAFSVRAAVLPHPEVDCPLVVALEPQ